VIPWQSTICIRFSSMSLPDANVKSAGTGQQLKREGS
jgi:hypothetical protein